MQRCQDLELLGRLRTEVAHYVPVVTRFRKYIEYYHPQKVETRSTYFF